MKRNLMLYINSELIEEAKRLNINLSQEFNEYIKVRILGINHSETVALENIDRKRLEISNQIITLNKELEDLEKKKENLAKKDQEDVDKRLKELVYG